MTIQKTTLKRYNGADWDQIHLATSADITRVGTDITIMGNDIGAFKVGDVIAASDSIQTTLKKMVQTRIAATYSAPSIQAKVNSGTSAGSYEAGTAVNAVIGSNFTKNDAGAIGTHIIKKNGTAVTTENGVAAITADFQATLGDETVTYNSTCAYAEGVIKNDNLGDASPTGHITAGTKTSGNVTFTGIRKYFYGVNSTDSAALATSAEVRALSASTGTAARGNTFTITVPAGSKKCTIAYPNTIAAMQQVLYVEAGNQNITGQFVESAVDVEGANSYTAKTYRVYTLAWAQPTVATMTFSVKL